MLRMLSFAAASAAVDKSGPLWQGAFQGPCNPDHGSFRFMGQILPDKKIMAPNRMEVCSSGYSCVTKSVVDKTDGAKWPGLLQDDDAGLLAEAKKHDMEGQITSCKDAASKGLCAEPEVGDQISNFCLLSCDGKELKVELPPAGCTNDESGLFAATGGKITECASADLLGDCEGHPDIKKFCCATCFEEQARCKDVTDDIVQSQSGGQLESCTDAAEKGGCTSPKTNEREAMMKNCCKSCRTKCGDCETLSPTPGPTPEPPKDCKNVADADIANVSGGVIKSCDFGSGFDAGFCNHPMFGAVVRENCCDSCAHPKRNRRLGADNKVANKGDSSSSMRGVTSFEKEDRAVGDLNVDHETIEGGISGFGNGVCMKCDSDGYCPANTTTTTTKVMLNLCPEGSYCPSPEIEVPCPAGRFCPLGTKDPSDVMVDCGRFSCKEKDADTGKWVGCKGFYCSRGMVPAHPMKTFCPEGYYCPDPGTKIECPAGHWCMKGSASATKCDSGYPTWQGCKKGAQDPGKTAWPVFILFMLIAVSVVGFKAHKYIQLMKLNEKVAQATAAAAAAADTDANADAGAALSATKATMIKQQSSVTDEELAELGITNAEECLRLEAEFHGFKVKTENMSFQFDQLGLEVTLNGGIKKKVLDGVSGEIKHGTLVAVMGPSGAGKTTFMNTLCGRAYYGTMVGSLKINGKESQILDHREKVGFVPQDDIVHEDLTVEENMIFSALLRLPTSMTKEQKYSIVSDALNLLQIRHIRDSIVGSVEKRGISGGQRKRVNIGMEVCADPTVLFLDEPTSGLDSTSSEVVLGALKDMTFLGVTIVTVIHQPRYSIFTSFDQVLLLGVGGRTVYSGPAKRALPYFTQLGFAMAGGENPADFLMDVISGHMTRYDMTQSTTSTSKAGKPIAFEPSDLFALWHEHEISGDALPEEEEEEEDAEEEVGEPTFSPMEQSRLREIFNDVHAASGLQEAEDYVEMSMLKTAVHIALTSGGAHVKGASLGDYAHHLVESQQAGSHPVTLVGTAAKTSGGSRWKSSISHAMFKVKSQASTASTFGSTPARSDHEAHDVLTAAHIHHVEQALPGLCQDGKGNITRGAFFDFIQNDTEAHDDHDDAKHSLAAKLKLSKTGTKPPPKPLGPPRDTPSLWEQTYTFMQQTYIKQIRAATSSYVELVTMALSAMAMGCLIGPQLNVYDESLFTNAMLMVLFFGTLSLVTSIKTFGNDKLIFWRTSAVGCDVNAFFLASILMDLPMILLRPLCYFLIYCSIANPAMPLFTMVMIGFGLSWCCSGFGYVLSLLLPRDSMILISVIFAILMGTFLSGTKPRLNDCGENFVVGDDISLCKKSWGIRIFSLFSYARWGQEGYVCTVLSYLPEYRDFNAQFISGFGGFCQAFGGSQVRAGSMSSNWLAVWMLFLIGAVLRVITAFLLVWTCRDQQIKPHLSEVLSCRGKAAAKEDVKVILAPEATNAAAL